MGCCSNKLGSVKSNEEMNQIKDAIEKTQIKKITYLKKMMENLYKSDCVIDKPFTTHNNLTLSPLGYALVLGKFKSFQHLHILGASFSSLEELLNSQSTSVLEIICMNGFSDIFSYVLEIFDEVVLRNSIITTEGALTLDFERSVLYEKKEKRLKLPLFLAVSHGNLSIIDLTFRFFEQGKRLPSLLNINLVDQRTGENLALLACKKGDFLIVKYLHEVCNADFHLLNNKSENALIITAIGSKKYRDDRFFNVFVYLVEEVHVQFESIYEDLLLILEDHRIIRYFYKLKGSINRNLF
jgi:hypothetical protein